VADDVLRCVRCEEQLTFVGEKKFHEGGTDWGFWLGDTGELLTSRERVEMYICEFCGGVEFFLPDKA
jgi:hypothetical protein